LRKSRCDGIHTAAPPHIKIGARVVYRIADLDRWLESHRVETAVAE